MKHFFLPALLGLALGVSQGASVSAAPAALFDGSSWTLLHPTGAADLKTSSAAPGGGGPVLHVTVRQPDKAYYGIQLTHDIAPALPAGAILRYHFWARSATKNPVHAVIEKRTAPYTRVLDKALTLTPTWKEYAFIAPVPAAYGPKGLAARLQVGQQAGVIDVKGLTLTRGAH